MRVLILVVVEDGLRVQMLSNDDKRIVLILVVVEDGLRDLWQTTQTLSTTVLILVVVEDGLRVIKSGDEYTEGEAS